MKKVLVITNNLQQASYRLRIAELLEPLRQRGFELIVQVRPRSWLARRRLLRSAGKYDAVILQRKLLDGIDARLLRCQGRSIFYDVDDAVMHHANDVGWWSRWRTSRRFEATAGVADCVVAGNEHLADIFRQRGKRVIVLPTVVDPARYQVKRHQITDQPRLVWIGSHSTLPYLRQFLPAFEQAARRVPGLGLITIADATIESPGLPVEHIPWSAQTESESLCRGDIGIAPTPDDRWTRGKCGFKIVQYMAAGLPVIASPVGANAEIVKEPETGLLPARMEDWPDAIAKLAGDTDLRQRLGQAGRRHVERHYSLDRAADCWAGLLRN